METQLRKNNGGFTSIFLLTLFKSIWLMKNDVESPGLLLLFCDSDILNNDDNRF